MKIGTTNITGKNGVRKGFTLIELLVTIAIFVFMTALILARYNSFNSGTLLTNAAYDVALAVKEAQTYGIGVKQYSYKQFSTGYGLYFSTAYDATHTNTGTFVLFADKFDNDGKSNHACDNTSGNPATTIVECMAGPEFVKAYTLKNSAQIYSFCGVLAGDSWSTQQTKEDCSILAAPYWNKIKWLNITFIRPNPDAIVASDVPSSYTGARIYLSSRAPNNDEQNAVNLTSNGQLSVLSTYAPPPTQSSGTLTINTSLYGSVGGNWTQIDNNDFVDYGSNPSLQWSTNLYSTCTASGIGGVGSCSSVTSTGNGGSASPCVQMGGSFVYNLVCSTNAGGDLQQNTATYSNIGTGPSPAINLTFSADYDPVTYPGQKPSLTWNTGIPNYTFGYECRSLDNNKFEITDNRLMNGTVMSKVGVWDNPVQFDIECKDPNGVISSKSVTVDPMTQTSSPGSNITINYTSTPLFCNFGYSTQTFNFTASSDIQSVLIRVYTPYGWYEPVTGSISGPFTSGSDLFCLDNNSLVSGGDYGIYITGRDGAGVVKITALKHVIAP
ncbi:MAG: prepilin-type N-terminal cleavage/methylation domain-containing protein [Patescibacteria group bacterium]|nr:prepilin-type N-terminal cleavage/methylation domain-containing protein [Patescibacteria group bacterium]